MPAFLFKVETSAYVTVEADTQEEAEDMIYDDPESFMAEGDWIDVDVRFRREV